MVIHSVISTLEQGWRSWRRGGAIFKWPDSSLHRTGPCQAHPVSWCRGGEGLCLRLDSTEGEWPDARELLFPRQVARDVACGCLAREDRTQGESSHLWPDTSGHEKSSLYAFWTDQTLRGGASGRWLGGAGACARDMAHVRPVMSQWVRSSLVVDAELFDRWNPTRCIWRSDTWTACIDRTLATRL
jgi:hypothetical protein